jgi:predicted alpha/beta superfamily hydrolase
MKNFLITLLFCLLYACCPAQQIDTLSINSSFLKEQRTVIVYTPWQYRFNPNLHFDVLYVFDAQAREYFDMVTSTVAFQSNNICPMIIVGIISNDRNKDFLPNNQIKATAEHYNGHLGNADLFMSFIKNEVNPLINENYRTLPKRTAVGHSNGATFITYCFLKDPTIFDSYIAISPNFAYDSMQLVRSLQQFDPNIIEKKKFFYLCNAGGEPETGDWITARRAVVSIMQNKNYVQHLEVVTDDFSASESHGTVFQIGVLKGLRKYFTSAYFNAQNLVAYYEELREKKQGDLNADNLNRTAYNFYYMGNPAGALKILLWANKLFPEDLNLYDSMGEMYIHLKQNANARKNFILLDKLIEKRKTKLSLEDYKQLKAGVKQRLESLPIQK